MDVLIRGGTVVTMDPNRRVLRADVRLRGRDIIAIGRSSGPAKVLDARGAIVMPGFVQAHVHLCQALMRGMADDLPLLPWLSQRIWPLEAAHDARSLRASARLGVAELLRAGTTTVLDMGTVREHDVVFEVLEESGIRATSGKAMMDRGRGRPRGLRESTRESLREAERLADDWHGAAQGRLRYAFSPRFILSCSERLLRETAEAARERDVLVHTHAAEHADERAAVREALGQQDVAALAVAGITGPNAVLAHGVQLTKGEMKSMGRAGTRVAHCPSANLKLASGIADVVAMRKAGIVVGLGADGAPCNNRLDPFTELRQAALLAKVKRADAAALPALAALELATIDGARALGIDHETGSLEVGKRADVAVVDASALHAEPGGDAASRLVYACTAADVRHVTVDGQIVVEDRELRSLDEERVRSRARVEAKRLMKRADL